MKKLKDALEADTSEDRSTFLEEGIELIKQRNKLLVISDKYGGETRVAYICPWIQQPRIMTMSGGLRRPGKRPSCLRRRRKNNKKARDHQFRKRHFSVTETPVSYPCLTILPKGSAVDVGDPGTTPGPAEPLFLHIGQALHQPHNNSLVSHEEFNFVRKTQEDSSNLDNFVDLQNDVFTQNDNLSVFKVCQQ